MRSGWMRLVRMAAAGTLALGLWAQGAGAAEVKNVTAEYAWPWGVEIHYEVTGTFSTNDPLIVTATDRTKNVTYSASASALSGDTGVAAGKHQLIWDLDKQGVSLQSTNVVFTVEYGWTYCVLDLSGGANAASYPVTYMREPPSGGFNTDTYKTTKLVLRRIEAGTFKMCGSYQTTLSKPYYIGIFEVTQKQYALVMGRNPSDYVGDKRPVENLSWNTIRGNSSWPSSSAVSTSSFMGKLRARTGMAFDLPTEAQWEYACRAGTTSDYNNGGSTEADLKKVGRYSGNTNDGKGGYSQHTAVGSYQPNSWGLYDMHGNVCEWCLDWSGNLSNGVTDPKGGTSGTLRVKRGGSWRYSDISIFRSSTRDYCNPSEGYDKFGFRLVRN